MDNKACRGYNLRIVIGITLIALLLADGAMALTNDGGGNWFYSRDITINNSGSTLTDYQVLVNLTGIIFPTNANISGADIRFTEAGGSELPYWIENWDFTNRSGKVWVNVTNIPAGVSTLRMRYGNPNATSSSNGTNTYLFFDDFEGTVLKPQWTWTTTGDGSVTVANDLADLYQGSSSFHTTPLYGSNHILPSTDIVYTVRSRLSSINSLEIIEVLVENTSNSHFGIQARTYWDNQFHGCFGNTRCDLETNVPLIVPVDASFHVFDTVIFGGKANFYVDKVYRNQISDNLIGNLRPYFYIDLADGNHLYIDYVHVRKYTSPEPLVSVGSEGVGNWLYSRDLSIINPGSPLNYYHVFVNLTGVDFPIKANASGDDIRFTDSSGELPYWIENWDFTNRSGNVWVNVTNIPAGASTLRMWYGNPNATSSSNIKATFIDGDDFNTDTSSNYQWASPSGRNFYVSNGVLYIEGGGATGNTLVPKVQNPPVSYIIEMKAQEDAKHLLGIEGFLDSLSAHTQGYSYYMIEYYGDFFRLSRVDDGIPPFVPISFSANTWYYFLGRFSPSNISGKWNRAIDGTSSTDSTRTSGYYGIATHLANVQIDWWFVRSYASTEPSVSFVKYNLTGHVLNASSDLGISGALVKLDTYPQYNTTTNITGDYSMTVPSGTFIISASAADYSTNTTSVTINGDTVNDFALSILPSIRFH